MSTVQQIQTIVRSRDKITIKKSLLKTNALNWFAHTDLINIGVCTHDKIRAFRLLCPHMGADLAKGKYCSTSKTIQCNWHGYIFSLETGNLVENPNIELTKPARVPSKNFDPNLCPALKIRELLTVEDDDSISIYIDSGTNND